MVVAKVKVEAVGSGVVVDGFWFAFDSGSACCDGFGFGNEPASSGSGTGAGLGST